MQLQRLRVDARGDCILTSFIENDDCCSWGDWRHGCTPWRNWGDWRHWCCDGKLCESDDCDCFPGRTKVEMLGVKSILHIHSNRLVAHLASWAWHLVYVACSNF